MLHIICDGLTSPNDCFFSSRFSKTLVQTHSLFKYKKSGKPDGVEPIPDPYQSHVLGDLFKRKCSPRAPHGVRHPQQGGRVLAISRPEIRTEDGRRPELHPSGGEPDVWCLGCGLSRRNLAVPDARTIHARSIACKCRRVTVTTLTSLLCVGNFGNARLLVNGRSRRMHSKTDVRKSTAEAREI